MDLVYYESQNEFKGCPEDICEWVDKGADYNEWNLTPLIKDIQLLLNEHKQSLNYILLDYPFAYLNSKMREYIDFAVYIDTPLDIAMARRTLREFTENPTLDVRSDLSNYLAHGRTAYLEMEKTVRPNSNMVIDGSLPAALNRGNNKQWLVTKQK